MVIHSAFPDFILFLYVHLAHVDNTYDPNEIATIKNKMTRLFPAGTDLEKKLYLAIREYNAFDRSKVNELLKDSFVHFNENVPKQSQDFFSDVQAIVDADGKVLPAETEALAVLRSIIETHA